MGLLLWVISSFVYVGKLHIFSARVGASGAGHYKQQRAKTRTINILRNRIDVKVALKWTEKLKLG